MLASMLKKNASTTNLLIQFSIQSLPKTFETFYNDCKEQNLKVKRSIIPKNQIRLYDCKQKNSIIQYGVLLENIPMQIKLILCVKYIIQESQYDELLDIPFYPTLILNQGLPLFFSLNYDIESTLSQQQSTLVLCQLTAIIINNQQNVTFNSLNHKSQQIKLPETLTILQTTWTNMLHQIPGLGAQKCKEISGEYPTYQSLLHDWFGDRTLKNLQIKHGTKTIKLGQIMANKIYKVIMSSQINQIVA